MSDRHAGDFMLVNGQPAPRVASLAVDPVDSKVPYTAVEDGWYDLGEISVSPKR
jgi:hypothetical protein